MKEYTKKELIGNILVCNDTESYFIKEPSDGDKRKVNLNRVEKSSSHITNYQISLIDNALHTKRWYLIFSEGVKNTYEIY